MVMPWINEVQEMLSQFQWRCAFLQVAVSIIWQTFCVDDRRVVALRQPRTTLYEKEYDGSLHDRVPVLLKATCLRGSEAESTCYILSPGMVQGMAYWLTAPLNSPTPSLLYTFTSVPLRQILLVWQNSTYLTASPVPKQIEKNTTSPNTDVSSFRVWLSCVNS